MARYLGDKLIAIDNSYHPDIFSVKWSDHIINDIQWLRADTYSWQSGDVYVTAYNKLVEEMNGQITAGSEGGVSYWLTANGFKIAGATQEQAIINKYNNDGIAWFYILDTENKRFKLPRTKWGFKGVRDTVGSDVGESLPNIKGSNADGAWGYGGSTGEGAISIQNYSGDGGAYATSNAYRNIMIFDASRSSSTYQDGAPVQERATQMYLYFYVGEYAREAIEQTAGITSEQLNNKADLDSVVNKAGDTMTGGLRIDSMAGDDYAQFRILSSDNKYGMLFRADENYLWIIPTNANDPYGQWANDKTQVRIEFSTGLLYANSSNGVFLKDSYVSGTSGYNIWTNGYCEQWGKAGSASDTFGTRTVQLLKTFADLNYCVTVGEMKGYDAHVEITSTSSITFKQTGDLKTSCYWVARGYLAPGQY